MYGVFLVQNLRKRSDPWGTRSPDTGEENDDREGNEKGARDWKKILNSLPFHVIAHLAQLHRALGQSSVLSGNSNILGACIVHV